MGRPFTNYRCMKRKMHEKADWRVLYEKKGNRYDTDNILSDNRM